MIENVMPFLWIYLLILVITIISFCYEFFGTRKIDVFGGRTTDETIIYEYGEIIKLITLLYFFMVSCGYFLHWFMN